MERGTNKIVKIRINYEYRRMVFPITNPLKVMKTSCKLSDVSSRYRFSKSPQAGLKEIPR